MVMDLIIGGCMKIIELDQNTYQSYPISYKYMTKFYYDIVIKKKKEIQISIKRKKFRKKVEKSFDSKLFNDYVVDPICFAIFDKKKMVGVIEGGYEAYNQRFRIYEFLVDPRYRRMGYGKLLFEHMTEYATQKGARLLILETQSCNDPAIQFYFSQSLHFIGLDTMWYSNNDIDNKEVRLELGKRL